MVTALQKRSWFKRRGSNCLILLTAPPRITTLGPARQDGGAIMIAQSKEKNSKLLWTQGSQSFL